MQTEWEYKTKKNLLDLQYNKYLQYINTSIIIFFTYIIGLAIAFITKQIDYNNLNQLFFVVILSTIMTLIIVGFLMTSKESLKNIAEEIRSLAVIQKN